MTQIIAFPANDQNSHTSHDDRYTSLHSYQNQLYSNPLTHTHMVQNTNVGAVIQQQPRYIRMSGVGQSGVAILRRARSGAGMVIDRLYALGKT